MTTIGQLLLPIVKNGNYDEDAKQKIIQFYAANDETVQLPDTLSSNGALIYTVIDKNGQSNQYRAALRDVSLEAMLREAA